MLGIFADSHDHVDHVRLAVDFFNARGCELVLFAGDFVSPIVVPPLRKLACPLIACFGDNEGNRSGITGGMRIVGPVCEPPVGLVTPAGLKVLLTHQASSVRDILDGADVVVTAHTHKPRVWNDDAGRLHINPGETSGWTYRNPTVVLLDDATREATVHELLAPDHSFRTPDQSTADA